MRNVVAALEREVVLIEIKVTFRHFVQYQLEEPPVRPKSYTRAISWCTMALEVKEVSTILFFAFAILTAALLAEVEIQIEGKHGYAEKLPVTWKTDNKWVRLFFTGTSYHLYMGLFLLALVHLPFLIGLAWTIEREMLVLSFLAFMTVFEDFLWFVMNPHYGIRRSRRENIAWFQERWLWFVPAWYWWYLLIGVLLYLGGNHLARVISA